MKKLNEINYKVFLSISLIIIAFGILFNTVLKDSVENLGTVLIAVGGLFLIISMAKKSEVEK